MSWSLLTIHIISAIALQFMRGFYKGQQRPLTSNTTHDMVVHLISNFRI